MASGVWIADGAGVMMSVSGFLHLLWLALLNAIGLIVMAAVYAAASVKLRRRRYLAGGIDLVDKMTQAQFGAYLINYFQHSGYAISVLRQDEETGVALITSKRGHKRLVFAKRSQNTVSDSEVAEALHLAKAMEVGEVLIVTNSSLSRSMDAEVRKQGAAIWDREKLIPNMGKAGARKFALQAIENHAA